MVRVSPDSSRHDDDAACFRAAFEHAGIGTAIRGADGRWLRVNRAFCDIVGYTADELLGRHFRATTHPDDLERDLAQFARVVAGECDRFELDKRLLHKQGHIVWVTLHAVAVRGPDGAPSYYVLQYQDISRRRQAEAALRESEARYARIASHAPGIVYQYVGHPDGSSAFTFVSEGARTLFGVPPEAILRDPAALFGLVHPDDLPGMQASGQAAMAAGGPWRWEGRAVLPSGEERFVQVASSNERLPDGSVLADGVLMDVTELRRAARRLEESEERYRSLFQHHPDAVYSFDREGRFVTANPACEATSGYSVEELIGCSFAPLIPPEQLPLAARHFDAALAGTAQRFEVAIRHRSGHLVDIDVINVPIVVGGEVVGVFGIARDLTARRLLEAQLQQAQKMEAVGRLAGGVAHDFNNILAAIAGFAELLEADLPEGDPAREDVAEILKGTSRAAALTRQLLAFSRRQVLQPSTLDLNEVVAGTAAMLRPLLGPGLNLVALFATADVPVFADRTQLEQVLVNLALNARDAMPDGGTITIEVGRGRDGDMPCAVLTVADTGVGIPPAVQAQIFDPFFTTKPNGQGTGLGLATVHGIIQQSGGSIAVSSEAAQGTVFTITLPLVDAAPTEPRRPAAQERRADDAGRVLVVEDEDAVRNIARRVLERAGYEVLVASNGVEALDAIAAGAEVDVLLSDVMMPELGGAELAVRARERVPELRVILMSGYTDAEVGALGAGGAIEAFVQKPFTADDLVDAVRGAMRARAA